MTIQSLNLENRPHAKHTARMSNPGRAPKEYSYAQLSLSVSPDSFLREGYQDYARKHKKVEVAQQALQGLDMEVAIAFHIPKEHTVAASVLQKNGPALAVAKVGVPEARVRSSFAKSVADRVFGQLPHEGLLNRSVVAAAMRDKVFVDAGTEGALGRIAHAYPKLHAVPARPITEAEAQAAVDNCGVRVSHLPAHARRPFPLVPREGEDGVTVNPNSDNGFPVLGKWSTPGAAQKCQALAVTVRREIEKHAEGAEAWLREAEKRVPWLVALRGKAKADYYSPEKVERGMMRFYNAFPRQTMLNMQMATQVLEGSSRSLLMDGHSGIGVTLTRGGGQKMVSALQAQLERKGYAYVHVGDDSWVLLERHGAVHMFALDCSNFDLTQHNTVTREVHRALRDELRSIDRHAADLWHGYARERLVVVTGTLVRKFKHAGPSGMPLQSKVNDMLMDVMIGRTVATLAGGELTEMRVADAVATVGKGMGFAVRLEQYWSGRAATVVEALEQRPFLFIGYYFHVRGGEVRVCTDLPRTLAQLPFPALKWSKTRKDLQVSEAMRIGSIYMNLGMPPVHLEAAFETFQVEAVRMLEAAIAAHGDVEDDKLRWAVQDNPWGAEVIPSLKGLLRALRRDRRTLWMDEERELASTSTLVAISWADIVDADEDEESRQLGLALRRPLGKQVAAARIKPGVVPTHPATRANDGRPPPTAIWGPDKEPRPTVVALKESRKGARARRRDGLAMREFQADQNNYSQSDDSEDG